MSEYICKEDLLKEIEKQYCYPCKEIIRAAFINGCEICLADEMKDKIKNFPAADVEPVVHAKWILVDEPFNDVYICSNCKTIDSDCSDGLSTHRVMLQERCSQCGAKMDLE